MFRNIAVDATLRAPSRPNNTGTKLRWPTYLVTAPHAVALEDAPYPGVPYGEWHARRAGSLQTACGRSAVTWSIFWTLEFRNAMQRACPECSRVVCIAT